MRQKIPSRTRAIVLGNKPKCVFCGTTRGRFEPDHIRPVAYGGDNSIENLQCACESCNHRRRHRPVEDKAYWIKLNKRQVRSLMRQILAR